MMIASLRALKNQISRLARRVPQASPVDVRELERATLRLVVVLEHVAAQRPGYEPIPPGLLNDADRVSLAAWDGDGELPITLDPNSAGAWFARLASHLQFDGWLNEIWDLEYQLNLSKLWIAAIQRRESDEPFRQKRARARVLDDAAAALARIEDQGAAPPRWLPPALVADAREKATLKREIEAMNSEQRWTAIRELLFKAGGITAAHVNEDSPSRIESRS
jgi:hypothetical protein